MSSVAFLTLGCKLNYAETSTYERAFRKAGWEVTDWRNAADLYVVNTCTVTGTSDAKSRNLVRKVGRVNPQARIIVTGCSAELRAKDFAQMPGVVAVVGTYDKAAVLYYAAGVVSAQKHPDVFPAYSSTERTRAFLKVQDGCDNFCRYCTVPYARGRSRNVPIDECVAMAEAVAKEGMKEIVLTGVNTGDFGKTTGESFLDLLKALEKVEGIERYRISSIEPNLLGEDIIDWIARSSRKFQPHFHIPLQTGSDELLSAMGRHYDTAFFAAKIDSIRQAMEAPGKPKVFFGIDLMCGLPGETDELFEKTVAFIERIRPAFIHVFPYSRRPGTPAASMPGQVDDKVKAERVARMEELCARLHAEFVEANRGIREKVIFESKEKGGLMGGYTGNYIRITRPYDANLVGELTDIVI